MWLEVKFFIIFRFFFKFLLYRFFILHKENDLRQALLVHSEEIGGKWGRSGVLGFFAAGICSSYVTGVSKQPVGLFIIG